jgi:hypothetical protein
VGKHPTTYRRDSAHTADSERPQSVTTSTRTSLEKTETASKTIFHGLVAQSGRAPGF